MEENAKDIMAKQKKKTRIICYISLVILIILLLLPVSLRIFAKDHVTDDDKPVSRSEVIVLNCNKADETINSTFSGNQPHNILYKVKGNYSPGSTLANPDEVSTTATQATESSTTSQATESTTTSQETVTEQNTNSSEKTFMDVVRKISDISFDDATNTTSFRVSMNNLKATNEYKINFNTIDAQEKYFKSLGFSCNRTTI